uniref:Uncharacterized protein n=1 Tax=Setaria italica TaxID=4555 RepID=K3XU25_SETIT
MVLPLVSVSPRSRPIAGAREILGAAGVGGGRLECNGDHRALKQYQSAISWISRVLCDKIARLCASGEAVLERSYRHEAYS